MNWNWHGNLANKHADFSPSQPAWLRYDDERVLQYRENKLAAARGTKLHVVAKDLIELKIRQARSKKTFNAYVNDAIGYRMDPEVTLVYSDRFFGTADAISFENNFLRIHDLKTGAGPIHEEQVFVYAALFCLEYGYRPSDIQIELRIYQNDEVRVFVPDPVEIMDIMENIKHKDRLLQESEAV